MEEDNLVHAPAEPDLSQSGQQSSVPTGKTLGQIGFEASVAHFAPKFRDFLWKTRGEADQWEAAAQAIRDAVIEECAKRCDQPSMADELHRILTIIANEGFPNARDADVAMDAITTLFRDDLWSLKSNPKGEDHDAG